VSDRFQVLSLFARSPRKWRSYDAAAALGFDTKYARDLLNEMADKGEIERGVNREVVYWLSPDAAAKVDVAGIAVPREVQMLRRPEMRGYEARLRAQMTMAMSTRR
jgi:hypothetical protein